ncbi:hypothetical protein E1264_08340 [Actinomadura sp. KC216]|uniref:hypothetical protein n=1 Tax=Actinomadura sp. KC216 TaxID=2530370 RepID=UPI00104B091A|nr:hypothetical protein [Actinomadura sp. KC216]TDB89412.1 hypothetical protein E1264_08340 [Actinomadura sp. KC216]
MGAYGVDAYGISQVTVGARGIHLAWSGPRSWLYAPGGWTVRRRFSRGREALNCQQLDAAAIAELRSTREAMLSFGVVTLRPGGWLDPLDGAGSSPDGGTPAEVFHVDLTDDHRLVRVAVTAGSSMAIAYCEGRAVAVRGAAAGQAEHMLRAPRIDAVSVVTLDPTAVRVCVELPGDDEATEWRDATVVVRDLTLPFREVMPSLVTEADELAEARHRLLPGESIAAEEFGRVARVVRPILRAAGTRPSELALLMREEPGADDDEVRALDSLSILLAHPKWRRVLGFALFDDDPSLLNGGSYEYRISADFPAEDLADANHGFATVPSGTLLPADFSIGGVRIRLPQPVIVGLTAAASGDPVRVVRRGIALEPRHDPFWVTPSLDDWSLVADLPAPATSVILELAEGHDLVFDTVHGSGQVPAGTAPRLVFGGPAGQLRLRGRGFLHALRISTANHTPAEASVVPPPIVLADTPPPTAPLNASATNLQSPQGSTQPVPGPRHELGCRVSWRPSPAFGLTGWPRDAVAPPPLDAAIFEVQRRAEGGWAPVHEDENWTLGDRDAAIRDPRLYPGAELMLAFPETAGRPTGGDLDLSLVDVLTSGLGPGTSVRYRVRAVDAIGRPSATWTETAPLRLEKHVPPPVPIEVAARVLVRGAPDLTAAEQALLGTSDNAIVLRWSWQAEQRGQDEYAREFRIYAAPPLNVVPGQVLKTTTLSTGPVTSYGLDLRLDRPVQADVAAGLRLHAGHPFLIRAHTGGTTVSMVVETRLPVGGAAPVPALGPIRLDHPLTPGLTRPPAWAERIQVIPITDATAYEAVLRDRLTLTPGHPADALWVGVSAADDQPYVADQRPESRPGNESGIAPVVASGRYAGRPVLEIPPPLASVPRLRTPEPGAEPLRFPLDLTAFLPPAAFQAGRLRHERVAAGALIEACRATSDGRVHAIPVEPSAPGDAEVEIEVPSAADRAELVAALQSGVSTAVSDRFLVYLAGRHAYRDRLFAAAHDEPVPPGPFTEILPPAAGRWIYRVRAVDAAGQVSAGSATARVVVRVPSLMPGAAPVRLRRADGLRVAVPADPAVSHVLVFQAPSAATGPVEATEISRVPNRPDLPPGGGLWLRAPDGGMLAPTALPMTGPDVVTDPDGTRELTVPVTGERPRVWLATLTHDGVPSRLIGPYTVEV